MKNFQILISLIENNGEQMRAYLKWIDWSKLKVMREIKFIKSMYVWIIIVPIVAKGCSKINEVVHLTIFEHVFELNLSLPFSYKAFFFSALSFGLANLIYQIRCPNIIKDYSNYSQFTDDAKVEAHLHNYSKQLNEPYEHFQHMGGGAENTRHDKNEHMQRWFWSILERAKSFRPISQIFCIWLYVCGTLLMGYVFSINTYWVIRTLI